MKKAQKQKILIVGAGIAGPCLAYWLGKEKFEITIVEAAPSPREGGQNIDVHGPGLEIVKRMGLLGKIRARSTKERGMRVIGPDEEIAARLPAGAFASLTNKVEILRSDLAKLLLDAARPFAAIQFATSVTHLEEGSDGITVTFKNGRRDFFHLIVAADGMASRTRDLFLKKETKLTYLGVQTAYFKIPRIARDPNWAEWYAAPGGKVILLRPTGNSSFTSASVNFLEPKAKLAASSDRAKRHLVAKVLADSGWQAERITKGMESDPDFYLGSVSQVKASQWSKGRAVLLGDAAYCPSPFTGMGTTLAILGAYQLAYALRTANSFSDAFIQYEESLRPYVERMQSLPPGLVRLAYPKSYLGRKVFSRIYAGIASPIGQRIGQALNSITDGDHREDFPLPRLQKKF
jgi:2-polyprenyl-6-methoxyphenol hydroxylase-like FAD-dependent oxidoreductase